jgi:carbon-monoxide dehydrogenase small subunit
MTHPRQPLSTLEPDAGEEVRLVINGQPLAVTVPPARTLLDVLRRDLDLTGTKEGCGIGVCGACSVLVDGRLASSCLLLAGLLDGSDVRTIEGITPQDGLAPIQEALIARGGLQCGICTPGQVVSATALLAEDPHPSEDAVRHWMAGNLCRCTGYASIVRAVLDAGSAGAAPAS